MTKNIIFYDDVAGIAKDFLLQQFKEKERFRTFEDVQSAGWQELEKVAEDLYTKRSLFTGEGAQLDGLGQIIGVLRGTLDDEDYRNLLIFTSQINSSAGEPEILITALKTFTESTRVIFFETFPAAVFMFFDGLTVPPELIEYMDGIALGGVLFAYAVYSLSDVPCATSSLTLETLTDYNNQAITDYNGENIEGITNNLALLSPGGKLASLIPSPITDYNSEDIVDYNNDTIDAISEESILIEESGKLVYVLQKDAIIELVDLTDYNAENIIDYNSENIVTRKP